MRRPPEEPPLHRLLGVQTSAPWEEVRRAFREAVRATHPDLHASDPLAEQRLKALNGAWESVNTPAKWAAYVLAPPAERVRAAARRRASPVVVPSVGRLQVRRAQRGSSGLRRWLLELDGDVVGSVENGGTSTVEAQPGRHRLRVFYDWYSSLPMSVNVTIGQEVVLGCRQAPGLRASLLSPKRSLLIERLEVRPFR